MRFKGTLLLFCAMLAMAAIGCNDPVSQRRINMRTEHQRQFIADCRKSEELRAVRLREADEALQRWHRQRIERWNRIAPTIGDYVY